MERSFRYFRIQLARAGLWPNTRLARTAWYVLAVDLLVLALRSVLGSHGAGMSWWVKFLAYVAGFLFLVLAYRWLKARLLWRLRNRLIVTYMFIGVIPAVLLVTMSFIIVYLFAGQFANFVVTSELDSRLRSLDVVNAAMANELGSRMERGEALTAGSLEGLRRHDPEAAPRQVCAWKNSTPLPLCGPVVPFSLPALGGPRFSAIVQDQGELYLRSVVVLRVKGQTLTVVSSQPLDRQVMEKIAADLGEITLYSAGAAPRGAPPLQSDAAGEGHAQPGFTLHQSPNGTTPGSGQSPLRPTLNAGVLPSASGRMDHEITFGTPLSVVDWNTGEANRVGGALLLVQTRPSALYAHLFVLGEFAASVEYALMLVAVVFGIIVLLALVIGTRLTQTVTGAIAHLYVATHHINRGDFSHRIPVKSNDQLATLSTSFNSMAESLEKLIAEQKEKQKLENELVIAQEVQAQLFPRHISQLPTLEVHGFCRPARTVSGDYYDFLTVDPDRMILAVGDVSGKGISAALLMATIHSAVRAYSMEGIPILREPVGAGPTAGSTTFGLGIQGVEISTAALLSLLNHQLYASTPVEKYATLFLAYYDGRERQLTYSNAGHLPPLILGDNGSLHRLDRGGTVVGLFDDVNYEEGGIQLRDGEIFLAYSDGVTEPENDFGEFGEERLIELVLENRHLPLAKISEVVTTAVDDWIGAREQPDDVTLVLARAR
jgi:phosphoserine phosphatase RsbU/P